MVVKMRKRWLTGLAIAAAMIKKFWKMLKATVNEFIADNAPTYAASLAYYTVFSIAPTLVIVVAIAGSIFGADAARSEIEAQITGPVGEQSARALAEMVEHASKWESGTLATIIGIVVLVFGATGVFAELQTALNAIWNAKPPKINGVWAFFRTRFLSFTMVLGIGFLLLVSLVLSAGFSAFGRWSGTYAGAWTPVWQAVNLVVAFGVITVLIAMIYKILPDVQVRWRDVWLGAAVTAVLFNFGKLAIGAYLGKTALVSSYGAAGSLAALLVWVYYSAMILLLGAEFTQIYARENGSWAAMQPSTPPQSTDQPVGVPGPFGSPSAPEPRA